MSVIVCACGQESPATARFCAACGSPLSGVTAPPPVDQQVLDTLRGFVAPQVADRIAGDGVRPVEERRLVTALFADLSGFTTLAARLDPDELLAVIDPVVSGLTRIVSRYDGYVEKFAGDALLALFGAPASHEDDAARALAVALDMQAELGSLSTHPEARGLTLHVGVNTGTVVARIVGSEARMDYAVLGEAVILAQRLESLAPAGEVWVGGLTRQLAGPEFAFDDLGDQRVKGRAEPVPAYRLTGRTEGRGADAGPLVGRGAETLTLARALADVLAGAGAAVRLEGPAGSGKSRLLAELREEAERSGVRVVRLSGASHAQSPYRCVVPLVAAALDARYAGAADAADRWARLLADPDPPVSSTVTAVLVGRPGAADALGPQAPDAVRRAVEDAALGWLADLARRGPVVVEADGLQWFDAASRDVLVQAERRPTPGVLLCLSGREAWPAHGEDGAPTTVRLGPLDAAAVRALVVDELGLEPDGRLLTQVVRRGQGNALMVRESVRQLRAEGLLDVRHGHVRLGAGVTAERVPATLEALLAARLDALPPAALSLATTVAVVGFDAALDLVAAVSALDPPTFDARLLALTQAGVASLEVAVADGGAATRVRLESPLVRDLLYARLTARRRRELHRLVAAATGHPAEPRDETVALLAEHHFLAGELRTALPWLRLAVTRARRVLAQDTAALVLTRAVEAARAVAPDQLADLLVQLAEVRAEGGELDRAGDLYAEARAAGNDARAWAGGASVLRRSGDYAAALALLDRADAAVPVGDLRLMAQERSWTLSVSGDLGAAQAVCHEALALGDPDDAVAGLLLLQLVRAETLLGRLDDARGHADRAIANLRRAEDLTGLCTALRLLGSLEHTAGALDTAAATLEEGLHLARQTGAVEEIGGCQINLGLVHADRGDHRAAERSYSDAAVTFEQAGFEAGRAIAYGNRSYELLALGEHDHATVLGLQALALAERIGDHMTAGDVHQTLALAAERGGDLPEARRHVEAAVAEFARTGASDAAAESRALLARLDDRD